MKTQTNYLVTKLFAIGAILIALLIALASINGVMHNRQNSYRTAVSSITGAAGGNGEIAGPYLYVPAVHTTFTEYYTSDGTFKREKKTANTFVIVHPDTLRAESTMQTQMRTLGIYSAPVYTVDTLLDATFTVDFNDTEEYTYALSDAKIFVDTDIQSLQKRPVFAVSGTTASGEPITADVLRLSPKTDGVTGSAGNIAKGDTEKAKDARISADTGAKGTLKAPATPAFETVDGAYTVTADTIRLTKGTTDSKKGDGNTYIGIPVALTNGTFIVKAALALRGASTFGIGLTGRDTSLTINGDWPSPGFADFAYLPDTRTVTENGFSAEWHIPFTGCSTEEGALPDNVYHTGLQIGVSYIEPVNLYQKLHRAVTYGVLFLIVPFIVFFMFELFAKTALHPMHYLLNGASCAVFFLLLLSLSEHIPFGVAYCIGAAAVSLLVSWYTGTVCKSAKLGALMIPVFVMLYGYLYFALMSEDYALLIGSLFLFALLAAIMIGTRKVDWSAVGKKKEDEATEN